MSSAPTTVVQTEIPANLIVQAEKLVESGWFRSLDELMQDALRHFLETRRAELMEEFLRQDVAWGING